MWDIWTHHDCRLRKDLFDLFAYFLIFKPEISPNFHKLIIKAIAHYVKQENKAKNKPL